MPVAWRIDPVTGHAALFEEAPGGGDHRNRLSLRNRPLVDPENWLANIYLHTALDFMEVHSDSTHTVNHATVAALTPPSPGFSSTRWAAVGASAATWPLLTHSLGYVPHFAVVVDGHIVKPGHPVQVVSGGAKRARIVSVYATTAQILLREWSRTTSDGSIPAISKTYRVIVFRAPRAPSDSKALDASPGDARVAMGLGRFDVSRRYLQVVPGGSPFGLTDGRSIDLKKGAVRLTNPDGSYYDMVPTDFQITFTPPGNGGGVMYYDGSFVGSGIQVQAP